MCLYVVMCHVQEVTSLYFSVGTIYDWGMSFVVTSWQLVEYCFGHHLRFIIHIHLSHFLLCNLCTCGSSTRLAQFCISNEVKCMWLRCIHLNTAVYFWYHDSTTLFIVFFMKVGERNINSRVCMYPVRSVLDLVRAFHFPKIQGNLNMCSVGHNFILYMCKQFEFWTLPNLFSVWVSRSGEWKNISKLHCPVKSASQKQYEFCKTNKKTWSDNIRFFHTLYPLPF